jgi:hypothetical protein
VDWIDLAQNRSKWWVIVNTVMNFGFYRILGFIEFKELLDDVRNSWLLRKDCAVLNYSTKSCVDRIFTRTDISNSSF